MSGSGGGNMAGGIGGGSLGRKTEVVIHNHIYTDSIKESLQKRLETSQSINNTLLKKVMMMRNCENCQTSYDLQGISFSCHSCKDLSEWKIANHLIQKLEE
jgi:hypothetical protein